MLGDHKARTQAIEPTESFIVQAPAGSGKTGLITQRYLRLLATVEQPEDILAITFTRKAANEMRERIIEALEGATFSEPEDEHERSIWRLAKQALKRAQEKNWSILENPARLRIQTIDSLSASIVKQMPIVARFGAQPGIEEYAMPIYQKASEQFIQAVVLDRQFSSTELSESTVDLESAVLTLLRALNNNIPKLSELFTSLLARRDQWIRHFISGDKIQRGALESALKNYLESQVTELESECPKSVGPSLFNLISALLESQSYLKTPLPENHSLFVLQQFDDWPDESVDKLAFWQALASWILIDKGTLRKKPMQSEGFIPGTINKKINAQQKDLREQVFDTLETYPKFVDLLAQVRLLPNTYYSDWQWEFLEALMQCLNMLLAYLKIEFQAQGKVDFIELSMSAMYALSDERGVTDVGLKLDYQIHHILVDEFQDTSHGQFELLKQLTLGWEPGDGRTLFLVGDPMQSIYRFREADVGLFLSCRRQGLGDIELTPLSLTTNFRSQAGIVNWVNQSFARVFPEKEDASLGGVTLSLAQAKSNNESPAVDFIHEFADSSDNFHATKTLELIQSIKRHSPNDSLAVLVRSKSHASEVIELLQQANIQVEAVEMESLRQRTLIKILLNLTRWLLNAADDLALAAILRSNLVGCSVATLTYLFNSSLPASQLLSLWYEVSLSESDSLIKDYGATSQAISDAGPPHQFDHQGQKESVLNDAHKENIALFEQLNPDQRSRLISFYSRIKPVLRDNGRLPITEIIRAAWTRLGGLQAFSSERDRRDTHQYFAALNQKLAGKEIVEVTQLEELVERLFSATESSGDGFKVTIMTIHKSKGLEFDHVIMPHLEKRSAQDGTQLMLWQELPSQAGDNFLVAPVKANQPVDDRLYKLLDSINKQKQLFENGRLLYVGVTRAKKKLYLLAQSTLIEGKEELSVQKPNANSLLAQLWPVVEGEVTQQAKHADIKKECSNDGEHQVREWRRLVEDSSIVYPLPRINFEANLKTLSTDEATQEYQWSSDNAIIVGNLVHSMLQRIASDGVEAWSIEKLEQHVSQFRAYLVRQHVALQDIDACVNKILKALKNTLSDARGRWLLEPHTEAQTELPLSTRFNAQFKSFVIDRTFVENGIRWIIDYKTSEYSGSGNNHDLELFYKSEMNKYKKQLQQYAEIMKQLDSKPVRCALYLPLHQKFLEYEPQG